MIVKCEKCQTKFKVADDQISGQGTLVRCSKCQHTFQVRRSITAPIDDPFAMLDESPPPAPPASGASLADELFGDLPESEFAADTYTWEQWERTKAARGEKDANAEMDAARKAGKVIVKDAIADIALQQVLTRSDEFDVIATLNLNGDYLSDALAAQVGGIGIAPGGNINYLTGHAVFEATHGTAPKYANLDKVNPGSVILSGEMMLRYMGWLEAADAIITAMDRTIGQKVVTYDFARMMEGAKEVSTSAFGDALIGNL